MRNFLKKIYHYFLKVYHIISPINKIFINRWSHYEYLELGCGSTKRVGWLSVDYRFGSDITYDITKDLPFKDGQFEKIYIEHVLEHFEFNEVKLVLRNIFRVLKPGGSLIISVPDLQIFVSEYINKVHGSSLMTFKPAIFSSYPADILNYIFYMSGEHKMMFDFDSLKFHLESAGFIDVMKRQFDPVLDLPGRQFESLLLTCKRPI
jgi:predicted SAM-dependent methyltransferase